MSRHPRHIALGFSAALVDLDREEMTALPAESQWYSCAVAVFLGDQEITRIYWPNLVMHNGDVILDETVAQWLSSGLAALARARSSAP